MTTTGHPRRLVIAVVDDDRSVLESLEMLLASAEYDVRSFSAAAALLESGILREIDCLISDVGMPAMDGCDLAQIVQAARPELPIFLITGRPELLDRSPRDAPGHYRILKKPFNGPELLTTVGDALRGAHIRPPGS
jgi:FixJ family two-component response regulator